jgi:outer membrane protein assembly factor BamB
VPAAIVALLIAGCAPAPTRGGGTSSDRRAMWTARVDWPFSLAVAGRDAVVTVSRNRVVALDTTHGRERWHADVSQVTHYAPVLDAQTVLVSADDRFVALDRRTGARRWEAPVGEHAGGAAFARADADLLAVVTNERGFVAALDAASGQARWSAQLPGDVYAMPAADSASGTAAVVWHGNEDRLRVFDLATGAVRWEATVDPGATSPVIHRGAVVLGEGNGNFRARVVARDLTSGAERWSGPAPASFESGVVPGTAGHDVAVADHFGTVTLVEASTGRTRWQTAVREPILDTRVLVTDRAVVLVTYGGSVVVLDRATGRVTRRTNAGGFPVGIGASGSRLVFAVRLARPDRVEADRLP